jgi:urease accessory protein
MLIFTRVLSTAPAGTGLGTLILDHDQRRRARLQASLGDGTCVGISMPRGTILHDASVLATQHGEWCVVKGQLEAVSVATTDDAHRFARAAYHVGNRHVALQFCGGSFVYLEDSVVDKLCLDLGLHVSHETRVFEPERLSHIGHSHSHHGHILGSNSTSPSLDAGERGTPGY